MARFRAWCSLASRSGCASGPVRRQQELNALVWCDHTDPALLEPFEKQFDVKVNVKDYEGTGTALALIEQSRPGDWDVFVVDSVDVPRVVEAGILAPLPEAEFPWADIFPELRQENLHFKDGKMYAAPEKFGYNTLAYNKAKVDPADMRRTPVLWDPKYKGRIAVYDYYIPLMGMVAIGLGMKPSDITEANLPQIRDKLFEIKDNCGAGRRRRDLADGAGDRPGRHPGRRRRVRHGGAAQGESRPRLGAARRWRRALDAGDRRVRGQPEAELATEFVKYILRPEGQARLATSSCYWAMPANSKAALTDEQKAVLRWDEQPGFIAKSYPYFIPGPELDAKMLEVWTEFLQH